MIQFENIGLRYGRGAEVLHDVNFHLKSGSFHFLTGNSGAGKTSLLRLMYLHHYPTRGLITLFGKDISRIRREELPYLRRKIGVVFQDFRLLDHLSVFENVSLPLYMTGQEEREIQKNVKELLEWVDLGEQMHDHPPTLSGGQQQRVAIARAVVTKPGILLADEPTGNVDDAMASRLLSLFEQLNSLGTAVVIATHSTALIKDFPYPRLHLEAGTLSIKPPKKPSRKNANKR